MNFLIRWLGCIAIAIAGVGMIATSPNEFGRFGGLAVEGLAMFLMGRVERTA